MFVEPFVGELSVARLQLRLWIKINLMNPGLACMNQFVYACMLGSPLVKMNHFNMGVFYFLFLFSKIVKPKPDCACINS